MGHHVGGAGGDAADLALVDQLARQLMGAAEEGSGAEPTLRPLASASALSFRPSSTVSTNGFSE